MAPALANNDYLSALKLIAEVGQAVQKAQPDIEEFGDDHAKGTQAMLIDAGDAFAASTDNQEHQLEAVASAEIAAALVPAAFAFGSWLKSRLHAKKAA